MSYARSSLSSLEESQTRADNVIQFFRKSDHTRTDTSIPQGILDDLFDSEEFKRRLETMVEEFVYGTRFKELLGTPLEVDDSFDDILYLGEPDVVPKEAAMNLKKAYEIEDLSDLISFDTYWDE
jgi:hypothetical protein